MLYTLMYIYIDVNICWYIPGWRKAHTQILLAL